MISQNRLLCKYFSEFYDLLYALVHQFIKSNETAYEKKQNCKSKQIGKIATT